MWWSCIATLGLMALWGIGSIVALSVNCSAFAFTGSLATEQCPDQVTVAQGLWRSLLLTMASATSMEMHRSSRCRHRNSLDFITALHSLACPDILPAKVSGLPGLCFQTTVSKNCKLKLTADSSISVAALAILHVHLVGNYIHSKNPSLAIVPALVCQQVELCWSLISATIPNLKPFVKSFSSGFGLTIDLDATTRYGSRTYGGASYELDSVSKGKALASQNSTNPTNTDLENQSGAMQLEQGKSKKRADGSIESMGSQACIIRKDVQWKIQYDNE